MSDKRAIPHLLDEPPISVYPSLAVALGNVNKAIIFQQLHFLLNVAKQAKNEYAHIDGKWWVYNSYEQWREYFPWLAEVTIKGLFGMLEHDGLVISRQGVKNGFDRRKWYTIDYDAYSRYIQSIGQKISDVGIETIPSDGQSLSDDISETTSETTIIENTPPQKDVANYPKSLKRWKPEHSERYFKDNHGSISILVQAWGYDLSLMDLIPHSERMEYIQTLQGLRAARFDEVNYGSLAAHARIKAWQKNPRVLVMLDWMTDWRNTRLQSPPEAKAEPKAASEMTSYELAKMHRAGADEWQ